MNYLNIKKENLSNLEFSLSQEVLRSNRAGSYASHSIVGCNTRKYHGLLVCPIEEQLGEQFVLLSALDLSINYKSIDFNLSVHKYQGDVFSPRGHKYIDEFKAEEVPQLVYAIGNVKIVRESLLSDTEEQILIRYTVLEADQELKLTFTPFLAYRDVHDLSKANGRIQTNYKKIANGIRTGLYPDFPEISLQFSKKVSFTPVSSWYYNIEYTQEYLRGYEATEDLFVPGIFEGKLKKGQSIIFSAALKDIAPVKIKSRFTQGLKRRINRDNFKNCLLNSAAQFIIRSEEGVFLKAGFHWYGARSRDCFMSLPGLLLTAKDPKTFLEILDSYVLLLKNGLFPDNLHEQKLSFASADASFWFIWAVQQYFLKHGKAKEIWQQYGKVIKKILTNYQKGTSHNIGMQSDGLIFADDIGIALTWMNAIYHGKPITPRNGLAVEVNALWYNAICFSLEVATLVKDKSFIAKWKKWPEMIKASFNRLFWNDEKGYLADYINQRKTDWSIRPSQILAVSLPYSIIEKEKAKQVVDTVKNHLLSPRGLRTLAPRNEGYIGRYEGNAENREHATHQGSVFPWLLEHYAEAYLKVYGAKGITHIKDLKNNFEEVMHEHGLGTVSELYDGDPPHSPRGSISYAPSVASALQIIDKIETMETT